MLEELVELDFLLRSLGTFDVVRTSDGGDLD